VRRAEPKPKRQRGKNRHRAWTKRHGANHNTRLPHTARERPGRRAAEESDHRDQLLRARREWPCRRAADEPDEIAALHSMTSSADWHVGQLLALEAAVDVANGTLPSVSTGSVHEVLSD